MTIHLVFSVFPLAPTVLTQGLMDLSMGGGGGGQESDWSQASFPQLQLNNASHLQDDVRSGLGPQAHGSTSA